MGAKFESPKTKVKRNGSFKVKGGKSVSQVSTTELLSRVENMSGTRKSNVFIELTKRGVTYPVVEETTE